jgi:hypothetical protein
MSENLDVEKEIVSSSEKSVKVYAIIDMALISNHNTGGTPIYVGRTENSLVERLTGHFSDVYHCDSANNFHEYVRTNCPTKTSARSRFWIVELKECCGQLGADWEQYYIDLYRERGYPILNEKSAAGISQNIQNRTLVHRVSNNELCCRLCGETKSVSEFHKKTDSFTGRQSYCKKCQKVRVEEFRRKRIFRQVNRIESLNTPPPTSKKCVRCKKTRSIVHFYVAPKKAGGFQSYCKECTKAYRQENAKARSAGARESFNSSSL